MSEEFELENEQLDELEEETETISPKARKLKSGIRFARVLILLVMAVTAMLLIFINRDRISMDNFKRLAAKIDLGVYSTNVKDNAVIDYDYDASAKIKAYKDGIARVSRENLVITDNIGTQFQSVLTGFNDPQILTTLKYVCVFDRGSNRLIITDSFSVVFDTTLEYNIVNVSMNDNGYLAVVTESEAYKNHVIVYNSSFEEVYKINSMTRYIVSADISPDNKRVIVSSVYSKGESVISQINCYSLKESESLWDVNFENSVCVDVIAKTDGTFVGLFEWGVCVLDKNGKEKYRHNLQNEILQAYSIGDDKNNIIVTSASHSGISTVTVFNNNGKEVSKTQLDFSVTSVDYKSGNIALLGVDNIYLYNTTGKQLSTRPNPNDATRVIFSDKTSVVSVSASSAVYNLMK